MQAHVTFVCRVSSAPNARLGDVLEPISHVVRNSQGRCCSGYPASLLIDDLAEFVQGGTFGVAVDTDAFASPVGGVDKNLRLPPAVGAAIDTALAVGVTSRPPAHNHQAEPSIKLST